MPCNYAVPHILLSLSHSSCPVTMQYLTFFFHFHIHHLLSPGPLDHPFVPKSRLNIGRRVFSVAASTIWNQLPITIKSFETITTFRNKMQTYICLKLLFHLPIPYMITPNDFIYGTSEVEFPRIRYI